MDPEPPEICRRRPRICKQAFYCAERPRHERKACVEVDQRRTDIHAGIHVKDPASAARRSREEPPRHKRTARVEVDQRRTDSRRSREEVKPVKPDSRRCSHGNIMAPSSLSTEQSGGFAKEEEILQNMATSSKFLSDVLMSQCDSLPGGDRTGEDKQRCRDVCDDASSCRGYTAGHQPEQAKQQEKVYQCGECGNTYGDKSSCLRHQLVHSTGRPHQCDVCDKTFLRKSDLRRHGLVHSGERSHQCSVCSKAFGRRADAVRHEKTHAVRVVKTSV